MAIERTKNSTSFVDETLSNILNKMLGEQTSGVKNLIDCLPVDQKIPATAILLSCEVKEEDLPQTRPDTDTKNNIELVRFNPLTGRIAFKYIKVAEDVYEGGKYVMKACEPRECENSCEYSTWLENKLK